MTLALLITLSASPAWSEIFVVTKETDEAGACTPGDCALREAVLAANANPGADEIEVPAGTYQLSLVGPVEENVGLTGDLDITGELVLRGEAAATTVVVGDGTDRVIQVTAATDVTISGLTITGGASQSGGGGLRSTAQQFLLRECVITGNTAVVGDGGGLWIAPIGGGVATIEDCVVFDNSAPEGSGGGVFTTAASVFARTDFINLTISGNSAEGGGGIYLFGSATNRLVNLTIAHNRASTSIDGVLAASAREVRFINTLIADNDCGYVFAVPDTNGHNIEGPTATCFVPGDGNTMGVPDIMLGPLADNGGPTPTHALLPGSPAIDAALNADCPATDQRGFPRPEDGDADGSAVCDVGALELLGPTSALEIPALGEVSRLAFALLAALAGVCLLRERSGS